jgi:hypothetical protein
MQERNSPTVKTRGGKNQGKRKTKDNETEITLTTKHAIYPKKFINNYFV